MKVAYLVNRYPAVSHSFIRREIAGVEAAGVEVVRFSVRNTAKEIVDPADQAELSKTRVLLDAGLPSLFWAGVQRLFTSPRNLWSAARMAWRLGRRGDRGLLVHAVYLAEACLLARWLEAEKVDHLHAHFGTNSATVALLCHLVSRIPYSFTVHGPEEFDRPDAIGLGRKLEHAAFVVAVSSFGRSQLFRWCRHEHWNKIRVVHCGVDDSFLEHPMTPAPAAERVVCVGRICEQKGQLLLAEAVGRLASEGLRFEVVFVGDGEMRKDVESILARLGALNRVRITGWASGATVREELLAARAMVLPSFAEGLPVVIMEALALGRPVVSTYIAGIPELVQPGTCGWLIPAGSIDALEDALRAVFAANPADLDAMGEVGRQRVRQEHDAKREGEKLAAILVESSQSGAGGETP